MRYQPKLTERAARYRSTQFKNTLMVLYAFGQKNELQVKNEASLNKQNPSNDLKDVQESINVVICGLGIRALSNYRKDEHPDDWAILAQWFMQSPSIRANVEQFAAYCLDPKYCREVKTAAGTK